MDLKKSCLFLTFGEATCPGSLFLKKSSVGNKELTVNQQGMIIVAKGGGDFASSVILG